MMASSITATITKGPFGGNIAAGEREVHDTNRQSACRSDLLDRPAQPNRCQKQRKTQKTEGEGGDQSHVQA